MIQRKIFSKQGGRKGKTKKQQVQALIIFVLIGTLLSFHSRNRTNREILPVFIGNPGEKVTSRLANRAESKSKWCQELLKAMNDGTYREHRKQWEFCFMAHTLDHFGKLEDGKKGIGFAVGQEPLAGYFVKKGADLVVSDLPIDGNENLANGWAETGQHSAELEATFRKGIVEYETYKKKAKFIPIDMNNIPEELMKQQYDFVYSSSSLEHVGSVELGRKFIVNAMKTLKKGSIAVHTTELCINSLDDAGSFGHMSVWLKRDVDALEKELEENGSRLLPVDYSSVDNLHIDELPYSSNNHFILKANNTIHTSIALVIEKL